MFTIGLLLIWWVYRFSKSYWVTTITYLFYITNLTFFKQNILVKPFALSNLFIFASFAVLTGEYLSNKMIRGIVLFFSGLFLGISLGVRLIFILPVIFIVWIVYVMFRNGAGFKDVAKKISIFFVGVIIPMVPSIVLFIKEPLRAYSIWAGAYTQIYLGKGSNPDFMTDIYKDSKTERMLSGVLEIVKTPDIAFLILAVFTSMIVIFFFWRKNVDKIKADVYLLVCLIFGSIIWVYSHIYVHLVIYANQIVLFAILLTLPLLEEISKRKTAKKIIIYSTFFLAAAISLLYLRFQQGFKTNLYNMLYSSDTITTPGFVNKISDEIIKKHTKDVILDGTGGMFVFASGRRPLKGLEYYTDIPIYWDSMTMPEKAWKYLFIPLAEVNMKIEKQEFAMVILFDDNYSHRLRKQVEKYYDLYDSKNYLKPMKAWLLIYLPKNSYKGT